MNGTSIWAERPRGEVIDAHTAALGGLEQLRAVAQAPAMYHLTGTTFDAMEPGRATFSMPVTGWLQASQGVVPAGLGAIAADGALGCAIHTQLPAGTTYTTAELSLTFVRPLPLGGRIAAHGRALHVGRTLALSECTVVDAAGRLLAHGTSRCLVSRAPSGAPRSSGSAHPRPLSTDGTPAADPLSPFQRPPVGAVLGADVWEARTGLEVLQAQIAGELPAPPLHHLFGVSASVAAAGEVDLRMPVTGWWATPWGWPQGGFLAMFADLGVAAAVQSTVPAGGAFATVDLKVNFLRPIAPDGNDIVARGRVVHRGRSLAVARVDITDSADRLVAVATGSAQIFSDRRLDLRPRS